MKAVVYEGPRALALRELPEPALGAGGVRLRMEACGVCGTDVRIFKGEHAAYDDVSNRILGHEIVGTVVEVAADSQLGGIGVGDRVFVAPNIGCGTCDPCTGGNENLCLNARALGITVDGGFADQVVVPATAVERGNLIPLVDTLGSEVATLIEPLACVLRGQQRVGVGPGDTVLVTGGGPVGLLHVALAKENGASLVMCSEPSILRREAAVHAGAAVTIDPLNENVERIVSERTGGRGIDVVITAAPIPALQTAAIEMASIGGRILFFGGLPRSSSVIEVNSNTIHYRELTVSGTTASTNENCREAADLLNRGELSLDWMISSIAPLGEYARAIAEVQHATALKIVLSPRMLDERI